jgi:hypothetical protein
MQLKLRHIILFVIASALLMLSQLPGGALLAICALMQMNLLIHGFELTKKTQLAALKLFAISIPLFFFWGGIHAFATIYVQEQQYVLLTMTLVISFGLSFLLVLQNILPYLYFQSYNYEVISSVQAVFNDIKNKKSDFFRITFALYVFSFIPWLKTDWKLVFAIMATHLYLHRNQLKRALSSF